VRERVSIVFDAMIRPCGQMGLLLKRSFQRDQLDAIVPGTIYAGGEVEMAGGFSKLVVGERD
jgi:hypothetical protein